MYIVNDGKTRHTFDWITHIDNLSDLKVSAKNPAKKICFVQLDDYIDMWSCSSEFDAKYDLENYYKLQDNDFSHLPHYFCKILPFTSRPIPND